MALQITCPSCAKTFAVPESQTAGGAAVCCPQCGKTMQLRIREEPPASPVKDAQEKPQPPAPAAPVKKPVTLDEGDFLPDPPAKKRARHEGPIIGKLLDPEGEDGSVNRREGAVGWLEPLLKLQSPTDASLLLTSSIGFLATVVIYWAVLWPMTPGAEGRVAGTYYWADLFTLRGWVPYAIVFLTFWSMAILLVKLWKLLSQRQSLTYDLLPVRESHDINRGNAGVFRRHIEQLPLNPRRNFLVRRVLLALEHVEARGNVQEVGDVLQSQGDIDGARVDGSYTMLHVFIWAVPILGFIGTVIGISDAVNQFSGSLQGAEDLDVIKQSLAGVTGGLAVAFDTTLVALVMSMVIMFPANSLQKAEEELLISIDQYCNDHLLQRLQNDAAPPAANATADTAGLSEKLEAAGARFLEQMQHLVRGTHVPTAENGASAGATNGSTEQQADVLAALAELRRRIEVIEGPRPA
jgi:biopolymer transport protein ExbB/TolQ